MNRFRYNPDTFTPTGFAPMGLQQPAFVGRFLKGFGQEGAELLSANKYDAPKPVYPSEGAGQFAADTLHGLGASIINPALGYQSLKLQAADTRRDQGLPPNEVLDATQGAVGSILPVAGQALVKPGTSLVSRLLQQGALGAVGGGATDAAIQYADKGSVDPRQVAGNAVMGSVLQAAPELGQSAFRRLVLPKIRQGMIQNADGTDTLIGGVYKGVAADEVEGKYSQRAAEGFNEDPYTYTPSARQETMQAGKALTDQDRTLIYNALKDPAKMTNREQAGAFELYNQLKLSQDPQDQEMARYVFEQVNKRGTSAGQAVDLFNAAPVNTPLGAERKLKRTVGDREVPPEKQALINEYLTKLQDPNLSDRQRQVLTGQIEATIAGIPKPTLPKILESWLYTTQLISPKTTLRNILGNTSSSAMEAISNVPAAGLDWLLSKFSGNRTTTLPKVGQYGKSATESLQHAVDDFKLGISTSKYGDRGEKVSPPVFGHESMPAIVRNTLGRAEKYVKGSLAIPDAVFQGGRRGEALANMKAANKGVEAPWMKEAAKAEGEYAVFREENPISNALAGLKKGLNKLGVKDASGNTFGAGNIVMNYPQVLGAITKRGWDYSPAAVLTVTKQAAKFAKTKAPEDQRKLAMSAGRMIVGTGIGTGAKFLAEHGALTGRAPSNPQEREARKDLGETDYAINTTALARFARSGFTNDKALKMKTGDEFHPADFLIPGGAITGSAAASAKRDRERKQLIDKPEGVTGKLADALGFLSESTLGSLNSGLQSTVGTGLRDITTGAVNDEGEFDLGKAAANVAKNSVNAAVINPVVRQVRDFIDPNQRETSAKDDIKRFGRQVLNSVPGLSKGLPEKVLPSGKTEKKYPLGNNFFNTFINPAKGNKVTGDLNVRDAETLATKYGFPTARFNRVPEKMDLKIGVGQSLPSGVRKDVKVMRPSSNGKMKVQVTGETLSKLRKEAASTSQDLRNVVAPLAQAYQLTPEETATMLQTVDTVSVDLAKEAILGQYTKPQKLRDAVADHKLIKQFVGNDNPLLMQTKYDIFTKLEDTIIRSRQNDEKDLNDQLKALQKEIEDGI